MPNQSVIVLDFGGQYNQLIARRVRECNVYCEVKPHTMSVDEIRAFDPIGIIFTGGPQSVYAEGSPQVDPEIFQLGIPILGICYGCQLMAQYLGARVRQDADLVRHRLPSVPRPAGAEHHVDEPRRLHGQGAGVVPARGALGCLPDGRHLR